MSHHDRTYAMIDNPPPGEVWGVVLESSQETARISIDASLALVKWVGQIPDVLSGSTVYNHAGALAIMATPAWRPPDPPPPEEEP